MTSWGLDSPSSLTKGNSCRVSTTCSHFSPVGVPQWLYLFPTSYPWLYRKVHQLHHQHHVPFALAAQDASGAELLSLLLLALISAQLVGCHPLSEAVFHLINTWLAVEDHCGYDLPWALHRLLPFLGGAPYHQTHHGLHNCNYAPYFTHWDHLFGTYQASVRSSRVVWDIPWRFPYHGCMSFSCGCDPAVSNETTKP